MQLSILAVIIFCTIFTIVKALPIDNRDDRASQRMDTRDLSDYISWFWSPTDTQEPSTKSISNSNEELNEVDINENERSEENSEFHSSGEVKALQQVTETTKVEEIGDMLKTLQEEVKDSSIEEQLGAFNLLKNIKETIDTNPSEYFEMTFKKLRHLVYIGGLGSPTRSRGLRCFGSSMGSFSRILAWIFSIFGASMNALYGGQSTQATLGTGSGGNTNVLGLQGPGSMLARTQSMTTPQTQMNLFGLPISNGGGLQLQGGNNSGFGFGNGLNTQPKDGSTFDGAAALMTVLGLTGGNGGKKNNDSDDSTLLTMIRKNLNSPGTVKDKNSPRVVIVRVGDDDDKGRRDSSNSLRVFEIDGSPEERFKRIKTRYENNPDPSERVVIIHELDQLKRDLSPDSELRIKVDDFNTRLRRNPNFTDSIKIIQRNGKEDSDLDTNGEVFVIDGTKNGVRSGNGETIELLLKRINEAIKNNQAKSINDPDTVRRLYSDLNLSRL